jgi:hypothetical protein
MRRNRHQQWPKTGLSIPSHGPLVAVPLHPRYKHRPATMSAVRKIITKVHCAITQPAMM